MKERYNIIFAVFAVIFVIASIFSVYADSSNSSNSTNNTNSTNVTKNASKSIIVQPMSILSNVEADPATVNFGNLAADGTEYTFTRATTVSVSSLLGSGGLYVRASGDFTSGTNRISLSNFKYGGQYSGGTISKKAFTTDDEILKSYSGLFHSETVYMDYYITVPEGTEPGTYTTTITYTAT